MQSRTFKVVFIPEPEGGFTVLVPELPEVVTCGQDMEEAVRMAKEAIELALEVRLEDGEPVPSNAGVEIKELTVTLPEAA
jgi:antitoxin HicB